MKKLFLIAALLIPNLAFAASDSLTNASTEYCRTTLNTGEGNIRIAGTFDTATVTLYAAREDLVSGVPVWDVVKTYTSVPSPNPEALNFRSKTLVMVEISNVGASDLYCEIRQ